ncbi:MAG: hypothetical protein U9N40_02260 [Euryarchaeota archaeon]|nr:hypothetical protein [Euryarchaeota archaeon]
MIKKIKQYNLWQLRKEGFFVKFQAAFLIFFFALILVLPTQAMFAEATDEQLEIMNEIGGTDITIGEYLQKAWPQFYDELSDEQKTKVNRWKKGWPKEPVSIEENKLNWHSQNITSYTTTLNLNLKWKDKTANLSLMVYSPEGDVLGPFFDGIDRKINGQTYFFIRKEGGLPMGEWWYAVKGEELNGTHNYYF